MKTKRWKSLVLTLLFAGLISLSVLAALTFTDMDLDSGNVNPNDTVVVQRIQIVDGTSTINAMSLQNLGTADENDIVRIVIGGPDLFGADKLEEYTTLTGLRSGLLLPLSYEVPNGTHSLWIGVEIADAAAVSGGETIQFRVRFYSGSYTSVFLTDGSPETIVKAGFETVEDDSPSTKYLNPLDNNIVVQEATYADDDGNDWAVEIDEVRVSNAQDADEGDVKTVYVKVTGTPNGAPVIYTADEDPTAADWGAGDPIVFQPADFTPTLAGVAFNDDTEVVVEVSVLIEADPTDERKVRTRVEVDATENGETYTKSSQASTTHTIREQGFEETDEVSAAVPSGVKSPGEKLVQKVTLTDDDETDTEVKIEGIWIRNIGTATKDDIEQIVVKRGSTTLFTLQGTNIVDFDTGHDYDIGFAVTTVPDDESVTLTIEYEIAAGVTDGRTLRPRVSFWAEESTVNYESDRVSYPVLIALHPHGLEKVLNVSLADGAIAYSGQRAVVQKILCEDQDENSDSVLLNPVGIKNIATNPCTDAEVVRIEVRTEGGTLLGETTNIAGLNTGGIVVSTLQNNTVADDGTVTLLIYVTFAGPEAVTAGHKLKLETTVFAQEDGENGVNTVTGDVEWTLAINNRPVPNFTFAAVATAAASIGPMADFTYDQTIQFTGTATDPEDDAITSWAWDFGDETASSVQNPTHSYPNGGTFDVTLTVTDARGATGSVTKEIEVEGPPNVAPVIDEITANPETPAEGANVNFQADITDPDQPTGTAFIYAWDFDDDGATSTLAAPTHSYDDEGTYTVTLTVTDSEGATDTETVEVSVGNDPPEIGNLTAAPTSPSTGEEVQFNAVNVTDPDGDDIVEYRWNFGDGTTAVTTGATTTHIYGAPNTYTVTLVVEDERSGLSAEKEVTFTVEGPTRVVMRAYPNPAATTATINYFMPEGATAPELWIFDLNRNEILRQTLAAGDTEFEWNLRAEDGTAVSNGLYFCMITATSAAGQAITSEVFLLLVAR